MCDLLVFTSLLLLYWWRPPTNIYKTQLPGSAALYNSMKRTRYIHCSMGNPIHWDSSNLECRSNSIYWEFFTPFPKWLEHKGWLFVKFRWTARYLSINKDATNNSFSTTAATQKMIKKNKRWSSIFPTEKKVFCQPYSIFFTLITIILRPKKEGKIYVCCHN